MILGTLSNIVESAPFKVAPMRQLLVTFLIMSLLSGQLGMVGTLLMGHRYDQQRMLRRVAQASTSPDNASTLEYLVIPQAELSQPESSFTRIEEHEFFYRGKLYDIVHEEQRGTDWHVWALHDREEERYLEALARTLEPMLATPETHSAHPVPKVYWTLALLPAVSHPEPLVRSRTFPLYDQKEPQAPCLAVPHPPPWG